MEEDIKILKSYIKAIDTFGTIDYKCINNLYNPVKNILNELERLQKEFKAVDHECSRLERKEIELEKENEYYKDLIYALETYYDITEEDLEKCVKEDR